MFISVVSTCIVLRCRCTKFKYQNALAWGYATHFFHLKHIYRLSRALLTATNYISHIDRQCLLLLFYLILTPSSSYHCLMAICIINPSAYAFDINDCNYSVLIDISDDCAMQVHMVLS